MTGPTEWGTAVAVGPLAIEDVGHDLDIGTVVRTANAFPAAEVHVVGRWRRRCG